MVADLAADGHPALAGLEEALADHQAEALGAVDFPAVVAALAVAGAAAPGSNGCPSIQFDHTFRKARSSFSKPAIPAIIIIQKRLKKPLIHFARLNPNPIFDPS